MLPRRNTSRPPGRSRRARLGDPAVRVAPDARAVLREGEIEARVGSGLLRVRLDEREHDPRLRLAADAPSRAAPGVTSTPTGRAPCRASHAEKYAVPQPSSTTSSPSTSPSTPSRARGTPNTPHVISSSRPGAIRVGVGELAVRFVQRPRLRRDVVGRDVRQVRRGRTARARDARSPSNPSRGRCSRRARARSRRGSCRAPSRADSSRPSSSARPRSPTRR